MAEVLEPEPETAAAQEVETPDWKAPGDAEAQVGASRGRERCGPGWGRPSWGGFVVRPEGPADLSEKYSFKMA